MANLNRVFLMGNLTRDPELKYTQSGLAVCDFGLAVNRNYKTSQGEDRSETLFVDITAFGKQAETASEYLKKGRNVLVEGRLKLDQWTSQEGQKRSKHTVVADRVHFLGSPTKASQGPSQDAAEPAEPAGEDDIPF
ncbi:MAG: single-stranded DNA-binding protein [Planctomycetota bacterium]